MRTKNGLRQVFAFREILHIGIGGLLIADDEGGVALAIFQIEALNELVTP